MPGAMPRRVLRHLFTLCAAASLVLCVAACVLWWWSTLIREEFKWVNVDRSGIRAEYYLEIQSGEVVGERFEYRVAADEASAQPEFTWDRSGASKLPQFMPQRGGFWRKHGFENGTWTHNRTVLRTVRTPIWALA